MPKGARGKKKPAALELKIRPIRVPRGTTRGDIKQRLLDSIRRGDYKLPTGWIIQIGWNNHPSRPDQMKFDEWENAMADSTQGGRGWDTVVSNFIRNMR